MRAIVQILGLFALWLIMSGIYKNLIIGFGAISAVLCVWIIWRLDLVAASTSWSTWWSAQRSANRPAAPFS